MSSNTQGDIPLPTPGNNKRTAAEFLPRFFRTEANNKFLQATLDQLIQPGVAEKLNGYFGRKNAKAFLPSDNYVDDVSDDRQVRQFEPAVVIKDDLDNVTFYKDYNDYINQLEYFGAPVLNQNRLNSQESYAWNPHIDWDKFANFREYFWLPNGPVTVSVRGQNRTVTSTYTITTENQGDEIAYVFNNKLERNPTLKLYRGQTYRFEIDTPGHPLAFAITRSFTPGNAVIVAGTEGIRGPGLYDATLYGNEYDIGNYIQLPASGGVTFENDNNASTLFNDGIRTLGLSGEEIANVYIEKGVVEFTIPLNAPDKLYYISKNDIDTSGLINIYDIEENTLLDVENEIIGKKTYTSANGVEFSNGMKIEFQGDTIPKIYESEKFYIEGVGTAIKLIPESRLIISEGFSQLDLVKYDLNKFDALPFDNAGFFPRNKDYLTINRASQDGNAWSRYNRWFHRTVVEKSLEYNKLPVTVDEIQQAKRPIIEFEAGLKLFNYGTFSKQDVDLIDTSTTDIFSLIEGSLGYNVDGVQLAEGMRVLFSADTDILVNGKIYEVKFITIGNTRQISLVETTDSEPLENETILITQGNKNSGKIYFYNGEKWIFAQQKTSQNQAPLFDLCCPTGNFYSNQNIFDSSTFTGTKIFSYKVGSGIVDSELGFALSYRNIENSGDIVFEFNLLTESFTVQSEDSVITIDNSVANLRKYNSRTDFLYTNGWTSSPITTTQKVLRQYVVDETQNNNFEIDVYDNAGDLNDLAVTVYLDNQLQTEQTHFEINRINKRAFINFYQDLDVNVVVLIKTSSETEKNSNGWYDFPLNLERNPLNNDPSEFTLGEVVDHVNSMIEDLVHFNGIYPGISNLRDLGNVNGYGKRFLKHTGPLNLAIYHITNKSYNLVKALEFSSNEYAKFKRNFISIAESLGYDGPIKQHVDLVLKEVNRDKTSNEPFYFSDMAGYSGSKKIEYVILDPNNEFYALSDVFTLSELSSKQITVYLNSKQLIHSIHYTFSDEGFLVLTAGQQEDDILEIYEYESTDGSFIPPTPSKLGLYPTYDPHLTIDDTYITVNAGVSEKLTGPFKIYAELENSDTTNIRGWFYPVFLNKKLAEAQDSNNATITLKFRGLNKIFYAPLTNANLGAQDILELNEYPYGVAMIRGHDGSLTRAWKDYRDELLIDFEKRIFNNIKVDYSQKQLNIFDFVGGQFRNTKFTKNDIDKTLLKDFINWNSKVDRDYTINNLYDRNNDFTFNYSGMTSATDGKTLPGYWRAVYRQAFDTDRPHTHPWEMLGFSIKPSWWDITYGPAPYTSNNLILWEDLENGIIREPNKQVRTDERFVRTGLSKIIPVDTQGQLISPIKSGYATNFFFRNTVSSFVFGDESPVETAWRRSSEYPFALIKSWMLNQPSKVIGLGFDVSRTSKNLSGQYVYRDTGKHIVIKDLKLPNTYQDNERIITSGLVNYIYNLVSSNVLSIYDDYKTDLSKIQNQMGIKIGGFTDKNKFKLVLDSKSPSSSESNVFIPEENYQIFLNTSSPIGSSTVYSAVIVEKQSDGFIIRGYNYDTPVFNYYSLIETSKDIAVTVGGISEVTTDWDSNKEFFKGQIVEYNFKYYKVINDFVSSITFDNTNLVVLAELPIVGGKTALFRRNFEKGNVVNLNYGTKLKTSQEVVDFLLGYGEFLKDAGFSFNYFNVETGNVENWDMVAREFLFWTTQGWAEGCTIALSPSASQIEFKSKYSVVDDIYDLFYDYSLLKEDGLPLNKKLNSVLRNENNFGIRPKKTNNGIYNVKLPLVQKEHVVLIDNETVFNDIIYQPTSGYRAERIRVLGYRSDDWQGGLNIPGFMYDDAEVTDWTSWKDYRIGSLVRYKEFYYVAINPVPGMENFDPYFWYKLNKKPEAQMIANFDYKINQFADFYDLDTDNFDSEQQKLAQHLIGYQKRDYLANIVNDDVSQYKFYQGFIQEKGTKNALDKIFKTLRTANSEGIEMYEEWAIQTGRYGAVNDIKQVEFIIDEKKIATSPQAFELVNTISTNKFDKTYEILPYELFDAPEGYNHKPFPTTTLKESITPSGYVHEDDVEYKAGSIEELETGNVNLVNSGEYIWLTQKSPLTWTVYQIGEITAKVTELSDTKITREDGQKNLFNLYLDRWTKGLFVAGDIVGIKGASEFNLNGFYKVNEVKYNYLVIEVPLNQTIKDFDTKDFSLVSLRSVRVDNLNNFNAIIQEKVFTNQKVWIDNYNGNWSVLQNNKTFNLNQTVVSENLDNLDTYYDHAKSLSASSSNNDLVVGTPNLADGAVYYYKRSQEKNNLVLDKVFKPSFQLFDTNGSNFGESVSMSEDGKFFAVGIPNASLVKTKFKGQYDRSETYNVGDIVKHRETLWRVNSTVFNSNSAISYSTFNSYYNIKQQETVDFNLMLTGAAGLPNQNTDHFLVKPTQTMFNATRSGDEVTLKWNTKTLDHLDTQASDEKLPWNNTLDLSIDDINKTHVIAAKIDYVILLKNINILLDLNDTVVTSRSLSKVERFIYTAGDRNAVVYIRDFEGIINSQGELFKVNPITSEEVFVAEYEVINFDQSNTLKGYWLFETDSYDNGEVFIEKGTGLVYVDVRSETSYNAENHYYYNIYDQTNVDSRTSFITHLSYFGDPLGQTSTDQLSNLWVARTTAAHTAELEQNPQSTVFVNYYNYDSQSISLANTGFESAELSDVEKNIYELWDGYIDFNYNNFDNQGNTYDILPGDRIGIKFRQPDAYTLNTPLEVDPSEFFEQNISQKAEVAYVQRNFNTVRVYLKNLQGDWSLRNNTLLVNVLKFQDIDETTVITRIAGSILANNFNSAVVVSNDSLGKLIVFGENTTFEVSSSPEITSWEYYFYTKNVTQQGATVLENIPSSLNKNYTQVYHISADEDGNAGLVNEGAVAIYKRPSLSASFTFDSLIVSELAVGKENRHFGKKVKIVKNENQYVLLISSEEDVADSTSKGTLEVFRHGPSVNDSFKGMWNNSLPYQEDDIVEYQNKFFKASSFVPAGALIGNTLLWNDISWKTAKDSNYRGLWIDNSDSTLSTSQTQGFVKDSIVFYDSSFWQAKTNTIPGPFKESNWNQIPQAQTLDYLGYLPNTIFDFTNDMISFAEDFDASKDGSILVIKTRVAVSDSLSNSIKLNVYRAVDDRYILLQTIEEPNGSEEFAYKVAVNESGTKIAVSDISDDTKKLDQGSVYIYEINSSGQFVKKQILYSPSNEIVEKFGYGLSFAGDVLTVSSRNGDMTFPTTFDNTTTTFDLGFTEFKNVKYDVGSAYVYEETAGSLLYAETLNYDSISDKFGESLYICGNHIYIGLPTFKSGGYEGAVLDYRRQKEQKSWEILRTEINPVDINKIQSAFLYNRRTNEIVTYLDFIDPIQGKIAGIADQEISFKVPYDPAFYNAGNFNERITVDQAWTDEHTNKIWWNTSNARFTYPYTGNIQYQKENWNELQPESAIDVCEWIETDLLPTEWDKLADTEEGLVRGISGTSVYGNNLYSKKFIYDTVSGRFSEKYYYWVRYKRTKSNLREISALDIARLIAQPRKQGYKFISFLSENRFVLNNCNDYFHNDDIVLNIRYKETNKKENNVHAVYQLFSNGDEYSVPDTRIERKWFDSLIGTDRQQRKVPDINLTPRQRYGVQDSPRQGMFVNRVEALKQVIERINIVLKQNTISDNYNISKLTESDTAPSILSNRFDLDVDSYEELSFISTNKIESALIEPIIINGKIERIRIINSGRGYRVPPTYEIDGTGTGAEIKFTINNLGQITDAKILSRGTKYTENTRITVRKFSVLVNADVQLGGRWSIQEWNNISQTWFRKAVQTYDVSRYWNYIDWYADGYNEFTSVDFSIAGTYAIASLDDRIGSVIKVENVGAGGWLLLEKYTNSESDDYTESYRVIGRQNGTIQFSDSLYDLSKNTVGFDNRSFDSFYYDNDPSIELRIILETVRDELFVSDLKIEYNQLFMSSIRYILSEQLSVDWLFKTSFIKIKYSDGGLDQETNYQNNKIDSYRSYIEEVKPYKSVIRELVTAYDHTDNTNSAVSDFDLPAAYDDFYKEIKPSSATISNGQISNINKNVQEYPRRWWFENYGYSVKEIKIGRSGSKYTIPPVIKIDGNGIGATAKAYLGAGGIINAIEVTNPGKGYTKTPKVIINGSQLQGGEVAVATAVLGNGLVRSPSIKIKFDRTSGKHYILDLSETETFTGTNVNSFFNLEWPMSMTLSDVSVSVNNKEMLRSEYKFTNIENITAGYTRSQGQIQFTRPPVLDAEIVVTYKKNIAMLSAEDRILHAYKPVDGMLSEDLAQLLDGVDYGGVEITGFEFGGSKGWDTDDWFSSKWDEYDNSYEDLVFNFDGSTIAIDLDSPLEQGVVYNVYLNGIRIDDPNYGTEDQINDNAQIASIIGDGTTVIVELDELGITVVDGDVLIIRKISSDGSFLPSPDAYDMTLTGGDLAYTSATGIRAEDIIVDGDGFVTATTSKGTEELVPGQVMDTLDIQVYALGDDSSEVAFRQFKDMLNRTHFKRLDSAATELAQALNYYDLRIEVVDGTNLPEPNKMRNLPGIIWVNSERIEYFVKEGNTLRQLRRGTLGTGIKTVHNASSEVFDQGSSKNIPYRDQTQVQKVITSESVIKLDFVVNSINEFEVFVNGTRLRKEEKSKFNPTVALDSPNGDIMLLPEFEFNPATNEITISNTLSEDSTVTIVRKVGKIWELPGESITSTNTEIGIFLRQRT